MGAKAPTPGVGRRIAISEELKVAEEEWVRVRCGRDGKDVTLRHSSIGPEDERMCEAQAGVNLWRALADPSSVTNIAVIYWAARRKNGERKLAFADVVKSFPNVQAVVDADIDIWVSDGEPEEGSGEDEDGEGGADPTLSAVG